MIWRLCGADLSFGERDRGRGGLSIQELEEVSSVVLQEPVAVAAMFPFGEVLFVDGAVVEVGREYGFDFGEGVEPGKDGPGGETIVEFEVELFSDGVGKTSDFADASCSVHNILF
jgi:hypothetical protein